MEREDVSMYEGVECDANERERNDNVVGIPLLRC